MDRLVPNPAGSDLEHARYYHDDLDALNEIAARVERRRIETALETSHRSQDIVERDWLLERHARLSARLELEASEACTRARSNAKPLIITAEPIALRRRRGTA
jgi:hypothetical protein